MAMAASSSSADPPPRISISDVLDYGDPAFRRLEAWLRKSFGDDAGFNVISAFAKLVIRANFSRVSVRGLYRVPMDEALVVCVAPHANQFLDPLNMFSTMPRPISFIAARVTCDKLWLGRFSLLARASGYQSGTRALTIVNFPSDANLSDLNFASLALVPVRRAQDYRKPGKGVVFQPDPANPTLIHGKDTAFTEQLEARGGIVLPDTSVLEVVKIISDTECQIKAAPSPGASALLSSENPTKYKVQPYENQDNVYATVHAVLQARGAIGIFVEGGSHDRSSLLPFKAGAAIMALGAMAANPGLKVKILPVGLNYFNPDKFRSSAAVAYGDPIAIPDSMVEDYKAGGERKRKAVADLLQQITEAIKTQTVNAPDYDSLIAIQTVRRLVTPLNVKLSVHQKLDITRRITSYYLAHQDSPEMKAIVERCTDYNDELLALNIRDHQVMKAPVGVLSTAWLLAKRFTQLVVGGILAIPGLPLNVPIGLLAQSISKAKAVEAKKASTVKLEGKDVIASWKVLVVMGVAPIWYGAWLGAIDWWLLVKRKWSWIKVLLANPLIYSALWGIGFSNIWFADNVAKTFKSLRAIALSITNPNRTQALRKKRADLVADINKWLDSLPAEEGQTLLQGDEGGSITKEDREYNTYATGRLAEGRRPSLDANAFRTRADIDIRVQKSDAELFELNVEEDDDDDHEDVVEVIRRGSILPTLTPQQSAGQLTPQKS